MPKIDDKKGFSLIEVLLAMLILSMGLLGNAGLISSIIRGNYISKDITIATALAQEKMEEITGLGYSLISSSNTTTTEDYDTITNYPNYKRETQIAIDTPKALMKTVTIKVYRRSSNDPVELNTILVR